MSEQSLPLPLLVRGSQALGLDLTPEQLRRFSVLLGELAAGNQRANLTAVTHRDEVQVKHFLDSLTVVNLVERELPNHRGRLVDVGSGAGLPGLALAIVLPWLDVALLEGTAKKARFLEHAVRVLGVNAAVLHGRAEELAHQPEHREVYDVATARAVGRTGTLVELLVPFVRVGGLGVLMKTQGRIEAELKEAAGALRALHAEVEAVRDVEAPGIENHVLVLIRKRAPTGSEHPRRVGIPARRPLGG